MEVDGIMNLNKQNDKIYLYIILFLIIPISTMIGNLYDKSLGLIIMYIPNLIMIYIALKLAVINNKNILKKKYILLTILFFLMILSCIFAEDKLEGFFGYNIEGLITYISYLGFFYCGLKMTDKNKNVKLIKIFLIVSLIISSLCIFKFDIIYKLFNINKNDYYFYVGPFHQFNHFGHYLLICNICSLFMFINTKQKIIYFMINSILLYTLIINDTFSVYIAYICILILLVIYYIYKKQKIKEIITISLSFILISCFTFRDNYNVVYRNLKNMLIESNQVIESEKIEDIYTVGTDRVKLWVNALNMIKEKPFLGYGFENVKYEYAKLEINVDKPHNLILELSLNSGIPSMIIYFVLVGSIIIKRIKQIRMIQSFHLMSLLIVIAYLISSMFSNSTFYVSPYFYIFLGIIAQDYYIGEKNV